MKNWLVVALLGSTGLTPAIAQDEPASEPAPETTEAAESADADLADDALDSGPADDGLGGEAIVVTGTRLRGAVIGDVEPEIQLSPRDIRALGTSNVAELVEALAPQTGSTRGRGGGGPVVLLNGRRISGFAEIRDFPPEAIERVDILPEEAALSYGYRADQRVINIVLRPRFRAVTAELEGGLATDGGRGSYEIDANFLTLNDNGRLSLDLEYQRSDALLESERDLVQSAASRPFDLIGNVGTSPFGAEIDPALSALAGEPVTVAAVPVVAGVPTLGDFAAGANSANVTDLGAFRTLLPATEQLTFNGAVNRRIFGDVSATLNGRLAFTGSESRLGLPSATLIVPEANPFSPFAGDVSLFRYFDSAGPLVRDSNGRTGRLGLSLNGDLLPWRWSFTAAYEHSRNVTRTGAGFDVAALQQRLDAGDPGINPFAGLPAELLTDRPDDRARSASETADAQAVLNGPLLRLPAGQVNATFSVGGDARAIEGETVRGGVVQARDLSRQRGAVRANVDVPLTSRREGFLDAIGDLSANLNAEVEHFSDFGTLRTLEAGLRWSPIEDIDVGVSITDEDGAPTMQQLGDPIVLTPNVRVFDFVRAETVDISRLEGGNPELLADNRRVLNLRLSARPFEETNFSVTANYTNSRITNPIAAFPTATAEIEAAFPDRFQRDAEGRLLRIDARPLNFASAEREDLRWGFNYSRPIGPQGPTPEMRQRWRERREAGAGERGPRQGDAGERGPGRRRGPGGPGGFRGRGFGMFGGQGGGIQLALYHSWRLEDRVLIRPGVPELDFLNGSAVGNRGGRPRHEVELQAGIFRNGLGARLTGTWQSGTVVRGGPDGQGDTTGDLFFSDLATLNLRLFADLGARRDLVRRHRWLRGTRVTIAVDNILNARPDVRDAFGATPLSYQPAYLDPLGRTIRLSIRKVFF